MSSSETPKNQQAAERRDVTVSVPEHRADQFLALSRRVLAVWEYRDTFGEPGRRGRHHRRGRGFGGHRHGRCAHRDENAAATAEGGTVETA